MTERCPRDGKRLDHDGRCLHCGTKYAATVDPPMTQAEVRDLLRRVRRKPRSPKCYGLRCSECRMSGCGCVCHRRLAAALRREAAQVEHDGGPVAAQRAEELRRRADEVEP